MGLRLHPNLFKQHPRSKISLTTFSSKSKILLARALHQMGHLTPLYPWHKLWPLRRKKSTNISVTLSIRPRLWALSPS